MPYAAQFFAEKLNVPVEYFNPLRNVDRDPSISVEDLQRVAHTMGEVVGLGLRNLAHCPVELNLMPESTLKWQAFNQKKPYFIATVLTLVLGIAAMGYLFNSLAEVKSGEYAKVHPDVEAAQRRSEAMKREYGTNLKKGQQEVNQVVEWMDDRFYWADVFSELRQALIRAEDSTRSKFHTDTGIWIEDFISASQKEGEAGQPGMEAPQMPNPEQSEAFRRRYNLAPPGGAPENAAPPPPGAPASPAAGRARGGAGGSNEISTITVTFKALGWNSLFSEADKETASTVLAEIKKSPLFNAQETIIPNGAIDNEEAPGVFKFNVFIKLKNPLKL